jgi:hypothetical protein
MPISPNPRVQLKLYYFYCMENSANEIIEENFLLENQRVHYLSLKKFLKFKNNKTLTDEILGIEIIDNVLLFGGTNTYARLKEANRLSTLQKHLINTYLNMDQVQLDSQMMTNFKCLKRILNVKEFVEEDSDLSLIFKKVSLYLI